MINFLTKSYDSKLAPCVIKVLMASILQFSAAMCKGLLSACGEKM